MKNEGLPVFRGMCTHFDRRDDSLGYLPIVTFDRYSVSPFRNVSSDSPRCLPTLMIGLPA